MSEVAAVLAALFALGMMGLGLAILIKGARDASDAPTSWSDRPRPN
jgi:hypothetical protein